MAIWGGLFALLFLMVWFGGWVGAAAAFVLFAIVAVLIGQSERSEDRFR